jgi:hypothetical protein
MTPSNILDITQNQNGNTITKLLNSNAGAGALAFYSVSNGTSALNTVMYGTGFTTSGISRQNGGYIGAGGAGGLTFTTEAAQPIYFGINLVEVARFDTSGRLQLSNALIYGGVTLSNAVTGTGSMVLSISPTLTGTAAGQTNNAASETYWQVLNNSASNGAFAILRGSNGTSNVDFGMTGTGYSGVGSYTANQAYIRCDAANGVGIYAPTGPIKFNANGWSEVGRFGTNGLFYLGTTANNVVTAGITVVSGTNYAVSLGASSNGGTYYYQYMTGGTGGTISNNGTITTYASTSDERMKDWVGVVQSDKRQMISDLWLGDFDIYDDFTKTGTPHRGFGVRAQQAYGVLGTAFGFGPPHEETGIWQAPSEPMAFLALWGVKDLYKIIDDLTTRLEALESK